MAQLMGFNMSEIRLFDAFRINRTTYKTDNEYEPGEFYFKGFDTLEEYNEYLKHNDYGSKKHPAVCWGFQFIELAANKYEFEIFMNDVEGTPDQ
jgi:hypothetical protein